MSDDDKAEIARLRGRLHALLNKAPSHTNWSAGRSIDYKKDYLKAKKAHDKKAATAVELNDNINTMSRYVSA